MLCLYNDVVAEDGTIRPWSAPSLYLESARDHQALRVIRAAVHRRIAKEMKAQRAKGAAGGR